MDDLIMYDEAHEEFKKVYVTSTTPTLRDITTRMVYELCFSRQEILELPENSTIYFFGYHLLNGFKDTTNYPLLIQGLSNIHNYIPLFSKSAQPLRDKLVYYGFENVTEILCNAIERAGFERRKHLLIYRTNYEDTICAKTST